VAGSPEKRTPSLWAKNCLAALKGIDPSYERNRLVKGRFIEFVRQLPNGLYVSHNFLRTRDTYHLCFALLFSKRLAETLVSPLAAGARFDHNRTIWRQFCDDLGLHRTNEDCTRRPPSGVWSFGEWRRNTPGLVERGLGVSEEHLLPHYLKAIRAAAPSLVRLLERAVDLVPGMEVRLAEGNTVTDQIRGLVLDSGPCFVAPKGGLDESGLAYARLVQAGQSCGVSAEDAVSTRIQQVSALDVGASLSPDSVIVNHFEDFRHEGQDLAALLGIARALATEQSGE
tara:strand:- start:2588 stop:3439 length:852 start_codon:yes stop_codon:yes gene_type:complete